MSAVFGSVPIGMDIKEMPARVTLVALEFEVKFLLITFTKVCMYVFREKDMVCWFVFFFYKFNGVIKDNF